MLYCALDIIDIADDNALWIKVYEDSVRRKINPRESLRQTYFVYFTYIKRQLQTILFITARCRPL